MSLTTFTNSSYVSLGSLRKNSSSESYGFDFLLPKLEEFFPQIFSSQNYCEPFKNDPEQAKSFRSLLLPKAYAQLERILGSHNLFTLNIIATKSKLSQAQEKILSLAAQLEGSAHQAFALRLYQALAQEDGSTAVKAQKAYQLVSGGGSWTERFQYNLRHFKDHTSLATIAGLSTGMIVGSMLRYGGLRLLQRSSGFLNSSRFGGQILVRGGTLVGESLAVVAADQGFTQLVAGVKEDWSWNHLLKASAHMTGRLALIKGTSFACNGVFYGAQGIHPILGASLRLPGLQGIAQRLIPTIGLTGGIYLGPHTDYLLHGSYNLGEGHSAIDALFGAAGLMMAGNLHHLMTPRAISTATQAWNQKSYEIIKGQWSSSEARLTRSLKNWFDGETSFEMREAVAAVGANEANLKFTLKDSTQPVGAKWAHHISRWKWPSWRGLWGRRSSITSKPTRPVQLKDSSQKELAVGTLWIDPRAERRYVAQYGGPDEAGNIHWELHIKPNTKMGLPNICYGTSIENYRFSSLTITATPDGFAVFYQTHPSLHQGKPHIISQKKGRIFKLHHEKVVWVEPRDILVLPESNTHIKLQFLTPEEQAVPAMAKNLADQIAPLPRSKDRSLLGTTYLPDTHKVVFERDGGMEKLDLTFAVAANEEIRVSARQHIQAYTRYRSEDPSNNTFYDPLVDQAGQVLSGPLVLKTGAYTLFLRPLESRKDQVANHYVEIPVRITSLLGISLEPGAMLVEVGGLTMNMTARDLPFIIPEIKKTWVLQDGERLMQRGHSSWWLRKTAGERANPKETRLDSWDVIARLDDLLKSFGNFSRLLPQHSSFEVERILDKGEIPPWPYVTLGIRLDTFRKSLKGLAGDQALKFSMWGLGNKLLTQTLQAGPYPFDLKTIKIEHGERVLMISLNVEEPQLLSTRQAIEAYEALFMQLGFKVKPSIPSVSTTRDSQAPTEFSEN